jgi:hypothetical protein
VHECETAPVDGLAVEFIFFENVYKLTVNAMLFTLKPGGNFFPPAFHVWY